MAVWDIIGNSIDSTMPDFLNSTYSNIFGDITQQLLGGGRTVNIIGADQKFLFDWEILVESRVDKTGMMENPVFKPLFEFFMGSGGNASINIGDNNNLNLMGELLLNGKIGHILTVNLDDPWPLPPDPTKPNFAALQAAYEIAYPDFILNYRIVALANTLIVITAIICIAIAYFQYNNFQEPPPSTDGSESEAVPSIEDTKTMVLGIGLGVENRCFLYINQYLQTLGAKRTADKLAADQQAKDDAVAATGAEIARVEALANAAKDAADDAQAAAGAALDTANKAAGAADQAAQAAADAATANAEDTALLKEQMALLEARLTLVLNTGISELQVSVEQQIESIESVNGTLEKMQGDLAYVSNLAVSNNTQIQYLGTQLAKGNLDKINPASRSWSNLGGLLS
jgi:hypothetical protein